MDYLDKSAAVAQIIGTLLAIASIAYIRNIFVKSTKISNLGLWSFRIAAVILIVATGAQAWRVWFYPNQQEANLDIQSYCYSLGYTANSHNTFCLYPLETAPKNTKDKSLNLDDACSEQYREPGQTFRLANPTDSTTGFCYDDAGNQEKGLDVDAYCNQHLLGGKSEAIFSGSSADCRLTINMQIVCVWQYGTTNIKAQETDTTWSCYTQPNFF